MRRPLLFGFAFFVAGAALLVGAPVLACLLVAALPFALCAPPDGPRRILLPGIAAALAIAVMLVSATAYAADVSGTAIDLKPLLDLVFQVVASVAAALASVALGFLMRKLHVDAGTAMAAQMHDAIDRALGYGLHQARGLIDEHGYDSVTVKNAIVAQAANYAQSYIPGLLTRFNVDPAKLEDLILAHLGQQPPLISVGALTSGLTAAAQLPSSTIAGGARSDALVAAPAA